MTPARTLGPLLLVCLSLGACLPWGPFGRPDTLELDGPASPIEFRKLDSVAILIAPDLGQRDLARLGNFIAWSARNVTTARLRVWDDEAAWQAARSEGPVAEAVLAHERAEYVKDPGPPAVNEFTVFGEDGSVLYERDFLDWPVSGKEE